MAFPPLRDTEEMANHVIETFQWHWRSASHPVCPLPEDYQELCPGFSLPRAEEAAHNFNLLEMSTEVIEGRKGRMTSFPTILDPTQAAEYVRDNFRWSLRESFAFCPKWLPLNFYDLCPNFDLLVAMQFAHTAHISEMVQAIFYTMVLNEVAKLGFLSRAAMDRMMLDLRELKWDIVGVWLQDIKERLRDTQIPYLVEILANPQPSVHPDETSRLRGASPVSSEEE
ncbi:hypothetical protein Cgig2_016765 [Carnegiea gigantea]|uniref:Uncharacterized protein n=1 Tax=Carnegiea gigantea TaxID=171969 RepID=A0A9Q1GTW4_9CARY|nr:hypothetical protein Cgig2_016765 [Carnegiea gigantea]